MTNDFDEPYDDSFGIWREAVGFPQTFPMLEELEHPAPDMDLLGIQGSNNDSLRFFLNTIHRQALVEVYESLGTSRVVAFAPGHGASTLARWVYARADNESMIRRSIPVLASLERVLKRTYREALDENRGNLKLLHPRLSERLFADDPDHTRDLADGWSSRAFAGITPNACVSWIENSIREALVHSLVTRRWERVLNPAVYRELLGVENAGNEPLEDQRKTLAPLTKQPMTSASRAAIAARAPRLGSDDYTAIVRELNDSASIRISLLLDLSATPLGRQYINDDEGEYLTQAYADVLRSVSAAIKNIEQAAANEPTPTLPSLLDKTYFLSSNAWHYFSAAFKAQEDHVINFPAYRPVDLFAMLAMHYPPNSDPNGRRREVLAAVLDDEFIGLTKGTALSTEMVILEEQLRHRLAQGQDVRYHQHPEDKKLAELIDRVTQLEGNRRGLSDPPEPSTATGA